MDYVVRPPFANREGIVETLKLSSVPGASKADPGQFIDNSVVKSLEEQGFFRQLGMQR